MTYKPKLIEVALPLLAINAESAREKSIRHGHPSTLHLWWARRPLAAARAVIWASLVDDPSGDPTLSPEEQEAERQRLFGILERLIVWENSNNPDVLAEARAEIDRCFTDGPPPIVDPFGGGGAIPLEAQRLGLKAITGDLNPVAVLIQKAMLEIPPRFANQPPVHPDLQNELEAWSGAQGLASDIEAYGAWMLKEARRRIGHHYPPAITLDGSQLPPISWIWARTVKSPDPTWPGHVPLVGSWTLSKKPGKPTVWIRPIVDHIEQRISYEVVEGGSPAVEPTASGGEGRCLATGAAIPGSYIRDQLAMGAGGYALLAVVADGDRQKVYLSPSDDQEQSAVGAVRDGWLPSAPLPKAGLGFRVQRYGLDEWHKLFTPRQLVALGEFSDLLSEVREVVYRDALAAGLSDASTPLRTGGSGALAYVEAILTYLAFAIDRIADRNSSICSWDASRLHARNVFARQAISMTWDFAENNPIGESSGSWGNAVAGIAEAVLRLPRQGDPLVRQLDARAQVGSLRNAVVSSDPPYYDNIGYADLSDFFFVWLRHNLADVWPDECATLLTPKTEELIADPGRHGGRRGAETHFESGMSELMAAVCATQDPSAPATIYYAYKATESKDGEIRSTGWDTFLQAVIDAGLRVTATWPLRTELGNRMRGLGSNALASSIVLACRPRQETAQMATRAEFVAALRAELPEAVRVLQSGNIAPVDIPQSTIGPGIGVFSRYAKVVESDGSAMSVSAALSIINDVLGEILDGEESEMDRDSRFALTWYSQYGYNPASSGEADGVARAKNTSLQGVVDAGVGETRGGKFRLFERTELAEGWSPLDDTRATVWEATQHLIAALERSETEAAQLLHRLGGYGERARVLAYLLFKKATDKGWAAEAGAYNGLIMAWPTLRATEVGSTAGQQSMDLS